MYHNTTEQSGPLLRDYQDKANTQEHRILDFFEAYKAGAFSPSEVWQHVFQRSVPITSVRRGISELTDMGKLSKTDKQVKGEYGRPEYKWTLATGQLRLL